MKKCPKNKVLNTKTNRCIKKTCPNGKILSPKGRCVINRVLKSRRKKSCPVGKKLSIKGRCVKSKTLIKKVQKNKQTSKTVNYFNNTPDNFTVFKKKRVLSSAWDGVEMDFYFSILYLLKRYKNSYSFLDNNFIKSQKHFLWNSFALQYINRSSDPNNYIMEIPKNMSSNEFVKETKSCNKRFVILPVFIEWFNNYGGHINMILIDNQEKTIERFEPNKHSVEKHYGTSIFIKLDNQIKKLFPSYKYYPPSSFAPFKLLFQDIERSNLRHGIMTPEQKNDTLGYCGVWSIWYAEMRLKNPNLDRKKLLQKSLEILLKYEHSLRTFIRSYSFELIKFRTKTIKKHSNVCKKLQFKDKIVDMSIAEYNCLFDFVKNNVISN